MLLVLSKDVSFASPANPPQNEDSNTLSNFLIVDDPECGWVNDLVVEPGYIAIIDGYIDEELPVCLTQADVDSWFVDFESYGGYELWGGYAYMYQKGEMVGALWIDYTYMGHEYCCYDYWRATFTLIEEPVCLDSSYYPMIMDEFFDVCHDYEMIPGKDVDIYFSFDWTGCIPNNDQDFTVSCRLK